jgi:uncharacterized protein YihD (DUF1040 family)
VQLDSKEELIKKL